MAKCSYPEENGYVGIPLFIPEELSRYSEEEEEVSVHLGVNKSDERVTYSS
jgi:hypothetical protein